jgi:hypothetical protein
MKGKTMKIRWILWAGVLGLLGCNSVSKGDCACTVKACFQGLSVELLHRPDSTVYTQQSVSIAYADTLETSSLPWGYAQPNQWVFSSYRLWSSRPNRVKVHLDYRRDEGLGLVEKRITLDTALTWTSFVCNGCSGSASDCHDQMAYTAQLKWDLSDEDWD